MRGKAKTGLRSLGCLLVAIILVMVGFPQKPPKARAQTLLFNASGTWTAPTGVTSVIVEAWGGGGGGGGRTTTGMSGGGGGGAYAKATLSVTPGNSYGYTVGAGGVASSTGTRTGGDSLWVDGSQLKAAGGTGATANTTTKGLGGTVASSVGTVVYKGGDGADATGSSGGGGGGGAGSTGAGNDAAGATAGAGKTQEGGPGGNGTATTNAAGAAGTNYGAGGGGVNRTSGNVSGGAGAAGLIRITYTTGASFAIQTGYYMGDGLAGHAISGLGFTPEFVMIIPETTNAATFKTSVMPAVNAALVSASTDSTTSVITLNTDGFTLSTNSAVNGSGSRFTWIAATGSNCTSSGMFCVGQYAGSGNTTRTIDTGFQPSFVMAKRTSAVAAHFRTSSQPNDESLYFINNVRDTTGNFIKSFSATGFDVGATDNVNNGVYNFIAFKSTTNVFAQGTFSGNSTDDRNITGVGFKPNAVFIKNATSATASSLHAIASTDQQYGDYSPSPSTIANAADRIQALQSDGFQVGADPTVNGTGDTYYWFALAGAAASTSNGTHFKLATGHYAGNGTGQSITGLGFTPDLVIIKSSSTPVSIFRTSAMKGDTTQFLGASSSGTTGLITSMDADGFTVGTGIQANNSGDSFQYEAFGGAWNPETRTGADDFAVGVYYGTGTDNRDIDALPWQPSFVLTKRNSTGPPVWRSTAHSGDVASLMPGTADAADNIQSFTSKGFQLGTSTNTNSAGTIYYWFAFKSGTGFSTGSYTGDSNDNRDITSVGFQPNLVWVKRSTAVNGVKRSSDQAGDISQYFVNLADVSDRIQSLLSNGFQVGGNQTETNASGGTYYWVAWRNYTAVAVSVSISSDGTVSYGTLAAGASKSTLDLSDTQTAVNDGTGAIDVSIKTSAPSGWTLAGTAGADTFVHAFSTTSGSSWTNFTTADSYQSLVSNVAAAASQNFDLRITAPTSSTTSDQKSITITILATAH